MSGFLKWNKNKEKKAELEKDAVPVPARSEAECSAIAERNNMDITQQLSQSQLQLQQNTTNIFIQGGNRIHFGHKIQIQAPPSKSRVSKSQQCINEKNDNSKVYEFTKTIKMLTKSTEKMTPRFLDLVAANLGLSWERLVKDVLKIDEPEIEYTVLDYKHQGFKQVAYKTLEKFFQENPEKATVGWLITIMWVNDFKAQVTYIKDRWKTIDWSETEEQNREEIITDDIKELLDSNEELNECILDLIAQCLGNKYQFLGDMLNIEKPQLEYIEKDFINQGHKEIALQTLIYYFRVNPDNKKLGWIVNFLWQYEFYDETKLFCGKFNNYKNELSDEITRI